MSKIDDLIHSALEQEDQELYEQLNSDMNLFDMATSVFQGKNRWLTIMTSIWMLIFLGFGLYCGYRFFETDITSELVMWAAGFGFSLVVVTMMKLWLWMEIQKNAILREVKRVELQVARLHQVMADRLPS